MTYPVCQRHHPILICVSNPDVWHVTGGCPEDCYIPYVMCPIPSGSLSMCGGTPRGQCMTSSGQCSCNTGYSGVDCGSCALGYSREGMRCVLEGQGHSGNAFLAMPFWQCPSGNTLLAMPFCMPSLIILSSPPTSLLSLASACRATKDSLLLTSLGVCQTLRLALAGLRICNLALACLKLHHAMQNLLHCDDVLKQHDLLPDPSATQLC